MQMKVLILLRGMPRARCVDNKMMLICPSFTARGALDAVSKPAPEIEGGENVDTTSSRYATFPW